jgi:hypothetical protein
MIRDERDDIRLIIHDEDALARGKGLLHRGNFTVRERGSQLALCHEGVTQVTVSWYSVYSPMVTPPDSLRPSPIST